MIAPELFPYEPRRRAGTRAGRVAATRRRARSTRLRYKSIVRIVAVVAFVVAVIVGYLGLMANVTRMNYAIGKAESRKARLLEETARYEDTIARLESRERLSALAAGMKMNEPNAFASVTLPPPERAQERGGIAFLSSVAAWLR